MIKYVLDAVPGAEQMAVNEIGQPRCYKAYILENKRKEKGNWTRTRENWSCDECYKENLRQGKDWDKHSVQFSHSAMSDSLQPHRLQHARLPCPSPTPRPCSNSCPSSHWCHRTISSSTVHFSSCLQSKELTKNWRNQVAKAIRRLT